MPKTSIVAKSVKRPSIDKKFAEKFKKDVGTDLQPINGLELYRTNPKLFTFNKSVSINGYCQSEDFRQLLFISYLKDD